MSGSTSIIKNWKRFLEDLGDRSQVFVVGPMMQTNLYSPAGPTVYVDAGIQFRPTGGGDGGFPSVSVGDGDSGSAEMDVALPREKDYSDLAFVLQTLPQSVHHVELLGFLGGRRDHELINYGEVNRFLLAKTQFTTVRFDESVIAFSGGSLRIDIDGIFSLAVFVEANLLITGMARYRLPKPTKISPASSVGLSNVGNGSVVIECDKPCFLFLS